MHSGAITKPDIINSNVHRCDFSGNDLIFKVTRVLLFDKALSAFYVYNQWPEFDQANSDTSLEEP